MGGRIRASSMIPLKYEDQPVRCAGSTLRSQRNCDLVAAAIGGLQVPGKINTLQIDGCTKTSVVVDSCVASVDIINCKSCEIQVAAPLPLCSITFPLGSCVVCG